MIGQAARKRVLSEHTYDHRANLLEEVLFEALNIKKEERV
jgi:spore maturation protein CgeB